MAVAPLFHRDVFERIPSEKQVRVLTAAAEADINVNIATALKLYELDNGFFPTTDQGLMALIQKPVDSPVPPNWNGPYLEKKPLDPWKRPYQYTSPGIYRPHDYDLYTMGKDPGDEAVEDDITNWQ